MKAIIYAGISLFSVASVYGVADYYQTEKKGTLKNLYKETEPSTLKNAERTITTEEYSRGKIEEPTSLNEETSSVSKPVSLAEVKEKKKEPAAKKSTRATKTVNNRKINLENFSRAKLPVITDTLTKTETELFEQ
ncbi:hypothetical protein LK994_02985 [Ferruginibacter lapsinanis]|uniref:hypothetical protein n=1 Tax=Ferruginibacter lapsinanis TaxID=563172 RepID=UPI001E48E45E|nr:hypothetical protein [Ferruginibacter lapsinanis]UEG50440.1 hypothetical protein LK994_02985 [Ferruginibacter lapsinanis]